MIRVAISAVCALSLLLLPESVLAGRYAFERVVLASLTPSETVGLAAGAPGRIVEEPGRGSAPGPGKGAGPARSEGMRLSISPNTLEGRLPAYLAYAPPRAEKAGPGKRPHTSGALDLELSSVVRGAAGGRVLDVGAAFATHVVLHELGHDIVADYVGAGGSSLDFLTTRDGQFFFASSTVESIDPRSRVPYSMGGEFAADLTFEYALSSYRKAPTLFNTSLMLFSGTDLLIYSVYAFYLSNWHGHLDPIAVTEQSGISKEALLSVALAKTLVNAMRVRSGYDRVIPHFTVDRESVVLNLRVPF